MRARTCSMMQQDIPRSHGSTRPSMSSAYVLTCLFFSYSCPRLPLPPSTLHSPHLMPPAQPSPSLVLEITTTAAYLPRTHFHFHIHISHIPHFHPYFHTPTASPTSPLLPHPLPSLQQTTSQRTQIHSPQFPRQIPPTQMQRRRHSGYIF